MKSKAQQYVGKGFEAYGSRCNIINLIRGLHEYAGDGVKVFISDDDWYRTTQELTPDPNVIFPEEREVEVLGIQSHQERLNFSMLSKVYCQVRENGKIRNAYVFRYFPIITDGELNMQRLSAVLNEHLFNQFRDAEMLSHVKLDEQYAEHTQYVINLGRLTKMSSHWANPKVLDLVGLLKQEQELIAERRSLIQFFPKQCKEPLWKDEEYHENLPTVSRDQPKFYNEIKIPNLGTGFYEAPHVTYGILNYKAKMEFESLESTTVYKRYRVVKKRLHDTRVRIRCIVFACEMPGSKALRWTEMKAKTASKDGSKYAITNLSRAIIDRASWTARVQR